MCHQYVFRPLVLLVLVALCVSLCALALGLSNVFELRVASRVRMIEFSCLFPCRLPASF